PDHISAVTTLVAGERDRRVADAARMGLAWGAGHATSLFLFGLPIVLFAGYLPGAVQSSAEAAVGVMIVVLALRLLVRWRRGAYHLHEHDHEGESHLHLHGHAESSSHAHHGRRSVRTPLGAYAIGLVHGMGGSAGVPRRVRCSTWPTATPALRSRLDPCHHHRACASRRHSI